MTSGEVRAAPPKDGDYYRFQDYAGFLRRVAIELIDVAVSFAVWFALVLTLLLAVPKADPASWASALLVVVMFGYFVLLKHSRFGTLGYKVCRAQIVDFDGARPGLWPLTLRLLFGVIGPANLLLDLIWVPGDKHRQTLRDRFAQTYVIRSGARPEGRGRIAYTDYQILGWSLILPEVKRPG